MIKAGTASFFGALVALGIGMAGSLVSAAAVAGSPYCALRDPTHQLYALFPEATAYRSVVATVDEGTRDAVARELPFTIHVREIGEHTLYVPIRDSRALGFLHVRTEASPWGLIEIAWALDPSLKIVDFAFQRCRGSGCAELTAAPFKARLRGRSTAELRRLLGPDSTSVVSSLQLGEAADPLAAAVIRSALKTIAVTEAVWSAEVRAAQRARLAGT
jgi:hypothetical protein